VLALVVVWAAFSLKNPIFATGGVALSLAQTMSTVGILGAGVTLVLAAGEIDLSVGATYGLVGIVAAKLFLLGWSVPALIAASLGVGAGVGLVNGLLSTYGRLPSFIATLGTLNLGLGLASIVSGGLALSVSAATEPSYAHNLEVFSWIGGASLPLNFPIQFIWMSLVMLILGVTLNRSMLGFRMLATGSNPNAARVAGINIRRTKIAAFVLSGLTAAIAGIIDLSYVGSADPTNGSTLTFPVFAAVVIGGTSLTGGEATMIGTALGALLLAIITIGLTVASVLSLYQLVFIGGITLLAVGIDRWTSTSRGSQR